MVCISALPSFTAILVLLVFWSPQLYRHLLRSFFATYNVLLELFRHRITFLSAFIVEVTSTKLFQVDWIYERKSEHSLCVVSHIEKLLYAQHKLEKDNKVRQRLLKMLKLDFQKWIRSFFSILRKKYRTGELTGPVQNRFGIFSGNLHETLRNQRDFYAYLYTENGEYRDYGTPDSNPTLNSEFTNAEFLDCIYTLARSKAPGFDNISNEDMSLVPDDSSEDEDPRKKFHPCALISESCPVYGLTNVSHKIPREQLWDPSSKIRKNPCAILQIIDQFHS